MNILSGRCNKTKGKEVMTNISLLNFKLQLTIFFCNEFGVKTPRMIPRSPVVGFEDVCKELDDNLCPLSLSIDAKFCSLKCR